MSSRNYEVCTEGFCYQQAPTHSCFFELFLVKVTLLPGQHDHSVPVVPNLIARNEVVCLYVSILHNHAPSRVGHFLKADEVSTAVF